jgi:hypothetical protein
LQEGAEPPPERFEPPLESFETRIEIRKSYIMSAFSGAQPPPEYFLRAEPPLELFSGSATALRSINWYQSPKLLLKIRSTVDRFEICTKKLSSQIAIILASPLGSIRVDRQG